MKYYSFVSTMAVVGFLAGCSNVMDQRISAHQETWRKLPEQVRHRLEVGQPRVGDTEEMVSIALGSPDEVLPVANREGPKQTVWLYDLLDYENSNRPHTPMDPASGNSSPSRGRRITFQDGIVVNQRILDARDLWDWPKSWVGVDADGNVSRLDAVVSLTPEQKQKARDIIAGTYTQLSLLPLSPEESGERRSILTKMWADLRAQLTVGQQAKYDANPPKFKRGNIRSP